MSVCFRVHKGSGKAKCKICNQKISKEDIQIHAFGYQTSGNVHLTCLNKYGDKLVKS
jgi:hypothetical protein